MSTRQSSKNKLLNELTATYLSHGTHFPTTADAPLFADIREGLTDIPKSIRKTQLLTWLEYEHALIERTADHKKAVGYFDRARNGFISLLDQIRIQNSPVQTNIIKSNICLAGIVRQQAVTRVVSDSFLQRSTLQIRQRMEEQRATSDMDDANKIGRLAELAFAAVSMLPGDKTSLPAPASARQEQPIYDRRRQLKDRFLKDAVDLNFISPLLAVSEDTEQRVRSAQIKIHRGQQYYYSLDIPVLDAETILGATELKDFDNFTRHLGTFALDGQTSSYLQQTQANFISALQL